MKYTVIRDSSLPRLIEGVNEHLMEDWECLGGVAIWEGLLCQSMIKEEKKKPPQVQRKKQVRVGATTKTS